MIKTKPHPRLSQESEPLRGIELTCMRNLLYSTEERVYFKDLQSRFLLVSAGWIAAIAPDHSVAEVIGKTDFDFFGEEHAAAAFADEQGIISTGKPMVGKLERETLSQRNQSLGLDHQDAA